MDIERREQAGRDAALSELPDMDWPETLDEFTANVELTVVSNRGPFECRLEGDDGGINHVRGAGGVATALSYISTAVPITWVFSAVTNGDVRITQACESISDAELAGMGIQGNKLTPQFIFLPVTVYHKFYEQFSNRILWFLQHYMWNSSYEPHIDGTVYDAWQDGYVVANELFANRVAEVAAASTKTPVILLQDYHLYLTPRLVRQKAPHAVITHFTHIPWPEPRYWELLPSEMRDAIFRGLCAADILGFQTQRDARNFVDGSLMFLKGARVNREDVGVMLNQHLARVRVYPISVCPRSLYQRVNSPLVRDYVAKLRPLCGEKTIVRVDRLEPSKNIIRGLHAFDKLLAEYPEYVGRLKLLLFLVPSRERIEEYQQYRSETLKIVNRIKERYGNDDWRPIELFYENNYDQALAGMTLYDVLFVNPLIDGMNLVAKEGPIVNTKDGVLVLSEGAGAYQQLKEGVVPVAAADVEGTMRALRLALEMPQSQKHTLAETLRSSIEEADLYHWFTSQLIDVAAILNDARDLAESARSV